jgi:hypothetical protein
MNPSTAYIDTNGSLNLLNTIYLSGISEKIVTITAGATCDYSISGLFRINATVGASFATPITNVPSTTDLSRNYIITLMYPVSGNFYCNSVSINGATPAVTPKYNGGTPSVSANSYILQQIMGWPGSSSTVVLSTVSEFK